MGHPQQLNYDGLISGSFNGPHMHPQLASIDQSMPVNLIGAYRGKILALKNRIRSDLFRIEDDADVDVLELLTRVTSLFEVSMES
jgi:hypothetical protein